MILKLFEGDRMKSFEIIYEDDIYETNEKNGTSVMYMPPDELLGMISTLEMIFQLYDSDFIRGHLCVSHFLDERWYEIYFSYPKAQPDDFPYIELRVANGILKKSFNMVIPIKCRNSMTKTLITFAILAASGSYGVDEYRNAVKYMEMLNDAYDGKKNSDCVDIGRHKVYIEPGSYEHVLKVVSKDKINPEVNAKEYGDISGYDLWAESNRSKKVFFSGILKRIFCLWEYSEHPHTALEVHCRDKVYFVVYNEEEFLECFEEEMEQGFYCTITPPVKFGSSETMESFLNRDEYAKKYSDGCLSLKHVVMPRNSRMDYINIVRNAIRKKQRGRTYGEAFEAFFRNPTWRYMREFNGTKDVDIVEFEGLCVYLNTRGRVKLQFVVNINKGFFNGRYFSFNGHRKEEIWLQELIDVVFMGGNGMIHPLDD